jgi:hypothetical protein
LSNRRERRCAADRDAGGSTSPIAGDGTGIWFVAAIVAGGVAAHRTRRPAPGIAIGLAVGLAAASWGI